MLTSKTTLGCLLPERSDSLLCQTPCPNPPLPKQLDSGALVLAEQRALLLAVCLRCLDGKVQLLELAYVAFRIPLPLWLVSTLPFLVVGLEYGIPFTNAVKY